MSWAGQRVDIGSAAQTWIWDVGSYQYYEFQVVDRPLSKADREALRELSSRASITATRFTNVYNFGDFRGDPRQLMERWFDLHLYYAMWGRRLMVRVPERFLDRASLDPFIEDSDWVTVSTAGGHLTIDLSRDDEGGDLYYEEEEDGSGWLEAIAPLRADVLAGDLRLFYLLWLLDVQDEIVDDERLEPLPGLAPVTGALASLANFLAIDADFFAAAAESGAGEQPASPGDPREAIMTLSDAQKTALLVRVAAGDPYAALELQRSMAAKPTPNGKRRTAGELRARANAVRQRREQDSAERHEAEARHMAEMAAMAQRARFGELRRRGERVWVEIEQEIMRRNPAGYDRATALLSDLRALAAEEGQSGEFDDRLVSIRTAHEGKMRFLERLDRLGMGAIIKARP